MNRPYVICHMLSSIDGKVTGEFLFLPNKIFCRFVDFYQKKNRSILTLF